MTLPLNKEMLAAAYDYLRASPPFSRWNLPESEDVVFFVGRTKNDYGWYRFHEGRHTITASTGKIGYTQTLLEFLAHEMIHLHLELTGMESRGGPNTHNRAFRLCAEKVCKWHGFDPKSFY